MAVLRRLSIAWAEQQETNCAKNMLAQKRDEIEILIRIVLEIVDYKFACEKNATTHQVIYSSNFNLIHFLVPFASRSIRGGATKLNGSPPIRVASNLKS